MANLIQWDHRVINVHRAVQEAMNYHSLEDLQASYESCIQLAYEGKAKALILSKAELTRSSIPKKAGNQYIISKMGSL